MSRTRNKTSSSLLPPPPPSDFINQNTPFAPALRPSEHHIGLHRGGQCAEDAGNRDDADRVVHEYATFYMLEIIL